MKRSNIIFICLLVAFYLVPFLVYGTYCVFPEKGTLTDEEKECRVVHIENPSLTPEQVNIFSPADDKNKLAAARSQVYYEGKDRYAADIKVENGVLHIGLPEKNDTKDSLTLHIRLNRLQKVRLNGETIWP